MKRFKYLLVILVLFHMGVFLFATPQSEKTKQEGIVTLRISWWTNELRTRRTLSVLSMYEELNPQVKFEPEYTGWAQYWDKFAAQIAANEMPDIVQITDDRLYKLTLANLLSPLEGQSGLNLSGVDKNTVDLGRINGSIVGIPLGLNAYSVIYNPDLFQQAGVAEPTVSWTWKDFEAMSSKIHGALDVFGCDFIPIHDAFQFIPREHGKDLFSTDGKRLGYEDDAVMSDFLAMCVRLKNEGAMAGPEYKVENDAELPFTKEKAAMLFRWSNLVNLIYTINNKVAKIMVLPGPNNKQGMYLHPSMFFAISSNSEHKEDAARFISYWITDVEATKALEGGRGVPLTAAGRSALQPILTPQQQEEFAFVELIVADFSSNPQLREPEAAAEVKDILITTFEETMFGRVTPEEAAAKFRKEANAVLSR